MKVNKIIILVFLLLLCVSCGKDKGFNKNDAKMICKQEFREVVDDESITSTSNIYIDYDEDELVTKVIYQSISEFSSANEESMYEEIVDMYNSLEGIEAKFYVDKDSLVLEISYDYSKMNLEAINNKIGNMLDDDSILKKVNSLPISLEEFKKKELTNYECEVK